MGFTVEELEDAPIIVISLYPPSDPSVDPPATAEAGIAFQNKKGGVVARVVDFSQLKLTFGAVAQGMASDKAFQHPQIKTLIVGTSTLVKMAAEAYKQDQYGNLDIPVFASVEEAIKAARKALK